MAAICQRRTSIVIYVCFYFPRGLFKKRQMLFRPDANGPIIRHYLRKRVDLAYPDSTFLRGPAHKINNK
jgi:hypothetical protein